MSLKLTTTQEYWIILISIEYVIRKKLKTTAQKLFFSLSHLSGGK
jgi:hypothetical protein